MNSNAEAIIAERARVHGPPRPGFANLGLAWTAILQDHYQMQLPHAIPPHVAALMMAALKTNRAARPFAFEPDDYLDGQNYLSLAEVCRVSETKEQSDEK